MPSQYFSPYSEIVPDFQAFCKKISEPQPTHLRVNTLKASITETRSRLERRGVRLVPEELAEIVFRVENIRQPGHLPEFYLGHVHSQALSSVLAGLVLGPEPGNVVLDLFAAPGTHENANGDLEIGAQVLREIVADGSEGDLVSVAVGFLPFAFKVV